MHAHTKTVNITGGLLAVFLTVFPVTRKKDKQPFSENKEEPNLISFHG